MTRPIGHAVGTRFSDRVALNPDSFAKRAKIIRSTLTQRAGQECGRRFKPDRRRQLHLQAILPYVEKTEHKLWMEQIRGWQKNDYKPTDSDTELKPHQIIDEICNQAGPEAVYVTDVGQHQMWAAQYLHHTKSRGFLTSGGLGTMGFGYGAAIGAQMALGRDARVVMLTGDGSFHMNLNEGCTAVSYELPIITVIFNNQVLGMVRQWQTTFYEKRYSDTDPHRRTDFRQAGRGLRRQGLPCRDACRVQGGLRRCDEAEGSQLDRLPHRQGREGFADDPRRRQHQRHHHGMR